MKKDKKETHGGASECRVGSIYFLTLGACTTGFPHKISGTFPGLSLSMFTCSAVKALITVRINILNMRTIAIISSSVRSGRKSHRVALYFSNYLEENKIAKADIIDLQEYNFPLFDERLRLQEEPSPGALEFAERIRSAAGVIIVVPEYNGGYPASLKNVVDLLYDEWRRKPVAISTVSDGPFGGTQVITSIQFSLWKTGAWTVPAMFPVPRVSESFDEQGRPSDRPAADKRAARFINELLWCIEAAELMAARTSD